MVVKGVYSAILDTHSIGKTTISWLTFTFEKILILKQKVRKRYRSAGLKINRWRIIHSLAKNTHTHTYTYTLTHTHTSRCWLACSDISRLNLVKFCLGFFIYWRNYLHCPIKIQHTILHYTNQLMLLQYIPLYTWTNAISFQSIILDYIRTLRLTFHSGVEPGCYKQ